MKKELLVVLFTSVFCVSSLFAQKSVRIHERSSQKIHYSQVFESAKIIKLETSNRCLISGITTIKVDGDRIFIFDDRISAVFIFSQNGKFVNKIAAKGKGPKEMILPKGFSLDRSKKQIEILDPPNLKMLIFDYNGNYIETNKSVSVSGFEKLNNFSYIGYSYNYPFIIEKKVAKTELAIFDNEGRLVKKYKSIRNIPRTICIETFTNLAIDEKGNAYVIPIFENSLFRIDQSLDIMKVCDFKFDKKIPKGILSNATDIPFAMRELDKKGCPYFIKGLNVINNNINFSFMYKRGVYRFFWNLDSNKTVTVKRENFINNLALVESRGFRGTFNNGVIDVIPAHILIESYQKAIEINKEILIVKSLEMRDKISSIVKETSPNDNPILIFYTYK